MIDWKTGMWGITHAEVGRVRIAIIDTHANTYYIKVERVAVAKVKGVTPDGAKASARRLAIKALRASLEALEAEEAAASKTGPTGGTES